VTSDIPLHRVVLTGGPCGGKTTALAHIAERLQSLGLGVYLVPEAYTLLNTGGASARGASTEQLLRFQASQLRLMIAMEDAFLEIARAAGRPAVLVCDRGTLDIAAYVPPGAMWQAILDENGWSVTDLRDRRYDAVIHLVTAANGAEAFYTCANNPARTETPEQARAVDLRLQNAWVGHPRLWVIDNSTPFADKVRRVVAAVCRVVGLPEPVQRQRVFLVRRAPAVSDMPVRCEEVEIEQTYLRTGDGSEARVRRRGQYGAYAYTHTVKRPFHAGQRVQVERRISARHYLSLLAEADPGRHTVRKRRRCFLWQNQYWELDLFVEPRPGLMILQAEIEDDRGLVAPPFLEIDREITGEAAFTNYALAAR
jgi:CYTH domain-containing protein/predicted ATPase